jgi:hypothetical protein
MPKFIECCIVQEGASIIKADITKTTLLNVDAVLTINEWKADEKFGARKDGSLVTGCHVDTVVGKVKIAGYTAKEFLALLVS